MGRLAQPRSAQAMIVAIASGKGGTGKTTVSASSAAVWNQPVIVNQYDLNPEIAGQIEARCLEGGYTVVARLPHDPDFVRAMVQGKALTEFSSGDTALQTELAWKRISGLAELPNSGCRALPSDAGTPEAGTANESRQLQTTNH